MKLESGQRLLDDSERTVQSLGMLMVDGVALLEAVRARDFDEARFRCDAIGRRAWSHNWSKVGNPALELEICLRHAEQEEPGYLDVSVAALMGAIDRHVAPLRGAGR